MSHSDVFQTQQFSRLLRLPREVRDLVYEHVLVRDVIPIEAAVVKIPEVTANRSPGYSYNVRELFPCRFRWSYRRLWLVPVLDVVSDFGPRDRTEDPRSTRSISMTYQLARRSDLREEDALGLRLLRTCRQVHVEAREVFYSKNIFSFTAEFRIGTAFAFLCDRPAQSLRLVRSIELALMEGHNMRATDGAHYPMTSRSTDSMVLQYAYNHFTDLTTLLSTSRMQLKRLYLGIYTQKSTYDTPPTTFEACIAWETAKMRNSPLVPSWVNPLLQVGGLESIYVCWSFARPCIRRMANTLLLMKLQMIGTPDDTKSTSEIPARSRTVRISARTTPDELYLRRDSDKSNTLELGWADFDFTSEGTWEPSKDDSRCLTLSRELCTPLLQDVICSPIHNYVCYSRLA